MININKVQIAGNITKPIELKTLPSGVSVAQITLACNRTWKNQNGDKQEETQFIDFVAFGKQAEVLSEYCVKGQNMVFFGRISNRSWDDKETGQKRYKTEVVLEEFHFGQAPNNPNRDSYIKNTENHDELELWENDPKQEVKGTGLEVSDLDFDVDEEIPF